MRDKEGEEGKEVKDFLSLTAYLIYIRIYTHIVYFIYSFLTKEGRKFEMEKGGKGD